MRRLLNNFRFTPAVISLIVMNLIPLVGVLSFNWDAATIVFLYWLENVIIGCLNIPKILLCRGSSIKTASGELSDHPKRPIGDRLFISVFFSVHYGIFCFGHYSFLQSAFPKLPGFENMFSALTGPVLFWSLLGLTTSHVISMVVNFYGKGEYKNRSANEQMFMPYSRIVVLHIVIILGAGVAMLTGQGIVMLILLVLLKIGFDLVAHNIEHSKRESLIAPSVS